MRKLGRDGRVPKRFDPLIPHGGMHFRDEKGQLNAGISRTRAAHPLDDSVPVHIPTVEKKLTPVEINPGARGRSNRR
jgi:hypothetical protein